MFNLNEFNAEEFFSEKKNVVTYLKSRKKPISFITNYCDKRVKTHYRGKLFGVMYSNGKHGSQDLKEKRKEKILKALKSRFPNLNFSWVTSHENVLSLLIKPNFK
jgi:hypothetical protein